MNNAILIKWLKLIAFLHVMGGLALAADFPSYVWQIYRAELFSIFNIAQDSSADYQALVTMIVRLFGATVASWGALMLILIKVIQAHGVTKYRLAFIAALLVWFVTDCTISFFHGVYVHLLINFIALLCIVIPLQLIKPDKTPI